MFYFWDFPSDPVVKILPFKGGAGSVLGQRTKIPLALLCRRKKKKKRDPSKNKKDQCSISYYRPMYCERKVQKESVVARELSKSEPGGHRDNVTYARLNMDGPNEIIQNIC